MAQTTDTTRAAADLQKLFDPRGYQNTLKTWANFNSRLSSVVLDAASKSTDILTGSAQETFSNLRQVTSVRDEAADYGKAYSDFVQKQMELSRRTAEAYVSITQKAGADTSELASQAGEELTDQVAANANKASDKAASAGSKVA